MSDRMLSGLQFSAGRMRLKDMAVTASVPYDASDFQDLKKHIAENGIQSPISIRYERGQNYIMQGHHRRRALKDMGHETGPVYVRHQPGQAPPDLLEARPITGDEYWDNMSKPSWTWRP